MTNLDNLTNLDNILKKNFQDILSNTEIKMDTLIDILINLKDMFNILSLNFKNKDNIKKLSNYKELFNLPIINQEIKQKYIDAKVNLHNAIIVFDNSIVFV